MPSVSVVIPTLNEAPNLPHVLPLVPADVHEVIVVDGASVDGTVETARQLLPSVRIVLEPERGKGAALRAGFLAATGDIIVTLDADGSTDPREIPRFVEALVAGADYAKGSRFLSGGGTADMSWLRALGNAAMVLLVRALFGARFTDLCYGYNAFWRARLGLLQPDCTGFEIETVMNLRAVRAHLNVSEVPSFERRRIHGASNLRTFPDGWRVLKAIFRERFSRPTVPTSLFRRRSSEQPLVVSDQGYVASAAVSGLFELRSADSGSAGHFTRRETIAIVPVDPVGVMAVEWAGPRSQAGASTTSENGLSGGDATGVDESERFLELAPVGVCDTERVLTVTADEPFPVPLAGAPSTKVRRRRGRRPRRSASGAGPDSPVTPTPS